MSTDIQAPGQATQPAVKKQSWFWGLFSSQPKEEEEEGGDCICCACRPYVTYCGRFDDSPLIDTPVTSADCQECVRIWNHEACPNCGCKNYETCEMCEGGLDD